MTECPTCATYPVYVHTQLDAAGRAHHTALTELRAAEAAGHTQPVLRADARPDAAVYLANLTQPPSESLPRSPR